jgi:hypothetical protein
VYLVTNRGERKATGSYYTPKYIVDYVVENTVGPLADEAAKKVAELRPDVEKEIKSLEHKRREWEKEHARHATESSLATESNSVSTEAKSAQAGSTSSAATDAPPGSSSVRAWRRDRRSPTNEVAQEELQAI